MDVVIDRAILGKGTPQAGKIAEHHNQAGGAGSD